MTAADSRAWESLYPFKASRYFERNGFRIHFLDSDQMASGTPSPLPDRATILCVHGNPTWSFYYREVVKQFASTHRVIAVDHLGCGLSDKPARNAYPYDLISRRDDLVALIDHLDLRNIVLLAHDWGGAIGLSAVLERLARLKAIMLLNTGAFPPPYVPKRIAILRTPLLGSLAIRGFNAFAGPAVTMAMSKNRLSKQVAEGLLYPYRSWSDRVAVDAFVRDIPLTSRHPTYKTLHELESRLVELSSFPKVLLWGMKDWCFRPECLDRFLAHWPHAQVHRLDEIGHYVMEDAPDEAILHMRSFMEGIGGR